MCGLKFNDTLQLTNYSSIEKSHIVILTYWRMRTNVPVRKTWRLLNSRKQ